MRLLLACALCVGCQQGVLSGSAPVGSSPGTPGGPGGPPPGGPTPSFDAGVADAHADIGPGETPPPGTTPPGETPGEEPPPGEMPPGGPEPDPGPTEPGPTDPPTDPGPCTYPSTSGGNLSTGRTMPNYTWRGVTDATGRTFDFSMERFFCDAEYARYRSLVVFVGAGWCGSCPSEIQRIDRMSSTLDSQNALILYVEGQDSSYNPATGASAAGFINRYASGPGVRAGDGTNSSSMAVYREFSLLPSGFFVRKRDMQILANSTGGLPFDRLAAEANTGGAPGMPPGGGCTEEPSEPNDSSATAAPISPGSFTGGICATGSDFFRIAITGSWRVDLRFRHSDGDLDLHLIVGGSRSRSSDSATDNESLTGSGPAVIEVEGWEGARAPYELVLTAG